MPGLVLSARDTETGQVLCPQGPPRLWGRQTSNLPCVGEERRILSAAVWEGSHEEVVFRRVSRGEKQFTRKRERGRENGKYKVMAM